MMMVQNYGFNVTIGEFLGETLREQINFTENRLYNELRHRLQKLEEMDDAVVNYRLRQYAVGEASSYYGREPRTYLKNAFMGRGIEVLDSYYYIFYDNLSKTFYVENEGCGKPLARIKASKKAILIYECLEGGYLSLDKTEKYFSEKEMKKIVERVAARFIAGNPSNETIFNFIEGCKSWYETKVSKKGLATLLHEVSVDDEETLLKVKGVLDYFDKKFRYSTRWADYNHEARNAVARLEFELLKSSPDKVNWAFLGTHVTKDYAFGIKSADFELGESEKYCFKLRVYPHSKEPEDYTICQAEIEKLGRVKSVMSVKEAEKLAQ